MDKTQDNIGNDSDAQVKKTSGATINTSAKRDEDEPEIEDGEVDADLQELLTTFEARSPVFEIKFAQKNNFHKLGAKILGVLEMALNSAEAQEAYEFSIIGEDTDEVIIRAFEKVNEENTKNKASDERERSVSPDFTGLSELFQIDTSPAKKLDAVKVPSYKRAIKDVLDEESCARKKAKLAAEEDKCRRPRPTTLCFNCNQEGHSIRDCTEPRDNANIQRSKKAFSKKSERYHVDVEQRFSHLRPGFISDSLRSALNLRSGELPAFFYRMRVLGYPPAWLEEAKVASSGISLFNADGDKVLKSDEDDSDAETGTKQKYDISKIIDFPGFNVNPGPNFFDDYKYFNVPPMNPNDMKAEFIKSLGGNIINGYKRKKLKSLPAISKNECTPSINMEVSDMDIEDADLATAINIVFARPPPPETPPKDTAKPPLPPTSPPPTEHSNSPTLEDLQAQQARILKALLGNTSISLDNDDSLIDEVLALEQTETDLDESNTTGSNFNDTQNENNTQTTSAPSTPQMTKQLINDIKDSHLGTPILQFSEYDKLPDGENFKVGVSDVINFENLPDSTGKYEEMKVLLKKVRRKITEINSQKV